VDGDASVPTPLSHGDASVPTPLSHGDASVYFTNIPLSRGDWISVHIEHLVRSMREGGYLVSSIREGGYLVSSIREGGYLVSSMREGYGETKCPHRGVGKRPPAAGSVPTYIKINHIISQ